MGSDKITLPLLPLRDIIVFPFMVLPSICRQGEVHSGSGKIHGRAKKHLSFRST